MSAIDGIIQGLSIAVDRVDEGTSTVSAVEQETDQALEQAVALGMNAAIEGFSRLKQEVEQLVKQLGAAGEAAKEVLATARAVADST
jgi:hypothetical protein